MADFSVTELDPQLDFDALPYWDVVIIGAGPAGLAAGMTTAHRGLATLVIEAKEIPGGQPAFLYPDKKIIDIPGFPDGITGEELSERLFRQAVSAQVQFRFEEELVSIDETQETIKACPLFRVVTTNDRYLCRKVMLACGLLHFPRKLPVLDHLNTKNVHYKVPRIKDYRGESVMIVGGGDSALDAAVMVLHRHGQVDLLIRGDQPRGKAATMARIQQLGGRIHTKTEIAQAQWVDGHIVAKLTDGQTIESERAIVQIGFLSSKEFFERLNLTLNEDGSVAVDPYFETSRSGIFAVGDVHGDIKLIAVAWAEGIQAATYAFHEITSPYWLHEKRRRSHKIALLDEKRSQDVPQQSRPERKP